MIIVFNELAALRKKHKNKTIVLGSGVFDLLHRGHVAYLQSLHHYGDVVVVMVKSDARVRLGKGPARPILPETDRVAMVDAVKGVDFAFIGPHYDFTKTAIDPMYSAVLTSLQPDVFYSTNHVWQKLEQLGQTRVVIGERSNNGALWSTTSIIEHIKNDLS